MTIKLVKTIRLIFNDTNIQKTTVPGTGGGAPSKRSFNFDNNKLEAKL